MRTSTLRASTVIGLLIGVGVAPAALGQQVKPASVEKKKEADERAKAERDQPRVHILEIYSGPTRTVRYFDSGISPGESGSLRDLERAETDLASVDLLQQLRAKYLRDELALQSVRSAQQQRLYGVATSQANYTSLSGTYYPVGNFGSPFYYGNPFGYLGNAVANGWGGSNAMSQNLSYGIGSEGSIKESLAPVLAGQAAADSTTKVVRGYADSAARVRDAKPLAEALAKADDAQRTDLKRRQEQEARQLNARLANFDKKYGAALARRNGGRTQPVATRAPRTLLLISLQNGEEILGARVFEDADWYVVDTPAQANLNVHKSRVARAMVIDRQVDQEGTRPAAD